MDISCNVYWATMHLIELSELELQLKFTVIGIYVLFKSYYYYIFYFTVSISHFMLSEGPMFCRHCLRCNTVFWGSLN